MIKKKWNIKKILILFLILLALILCIYFIYSNFLKEKNQMLPYGLNTLEDILEHYECKLIKKQNSEEENIDFDIYVKFGKNYYTENKSNEDYFTSLINYISENLEYKNYNLIDQEKEMIITALCDEQTKSIAVIYYNGDRNYFNIKDNEQNIEQYQETKQTKFAINSEVLQDTINNNWENSKINFGKKDSTFEEYDIYFDEGIQVKNTASKIYNIVFTEKYEDAVIAGLKVNTSEETIRKTLGTPAFINNDIIGYKGEKCYVFFSENEISVYRVENDYKNNDFTTMLEEFMKNRNVVTLFNNLTDIWNDYDLYKTSDGDIFILYTIKGVEFSFSQIGGKIIFYKNFGGQLAKDIDLQNIENENIPQYAKLNLTTDLVFEQEKNRVDINKAYYEEDFIQMLYVEGYNDKDIDDKTIELIQNKKYKTNNFYVFIEKPGNNNNFFKFISINKNVPNSELRINGNINDFTWLDDNNIIYSISR